MHEFLPYAWFEGKCIPFKEAKISIATHALHYGTAACIWRYASDT